MKDWSEGFESTKAHKRFSNLEVFDRLLGMVSLVICIVTFFHYLFFLQMGVAKWPLIAFFVALPCVCLGARVSRHRVLFRAIPELNEAQIGKAISLSGFFVEERKKGHWLLTKSPSIPKFLRFGDVRVRQDSDRLLVDGPYHLLRLITTAIDKTCALADKDKS